jgi:hypothetical protein
MRLFLMRQDCKMTPPNKKLGDSMTSESCVLIDIDDLQVTTYDDILLAIDELLELADIVENSGSYFTALDDIA